MDVSVSLAIGWLLRRDLDRDHRQWRAVFRHAVGMFALFLAGRYLERRARERTAAATAQLVNLLPASCLRLDADGQSERILLSELRRRPRAGAARRGDAGRRRILDGQSSIDESLLTGEYLPQPRQWAMRSPAAP
jgi:Cu2+-exporting ATPase